MQQFLTRPGLVSLGFYAVFALLWIMPRSQGSLLEPFMGVLLCLSGVFGLIAAVKDRVWWVLVPSGVALTIYALFIRTIH